MDTATSLRERKKQETRIALGWAAVRLSVERGFDNVRVEDIAAEVGVSTRTFSNYFTNKAEAIASRQVDRARAIVAALRARPADEPLWTAITTAVLDQFALGRETDTSQTSDEWVTGVRLMVGHPALQGEFLKANAVVEAEFATVIAERTGTDAGKDLYPRLVAGVVGAAINAAIEQWMAADSPVPMGSILREAFDRLAAGLPAD
jgi:AcrR family transcriptional regulator